MNKLNSELGRGLFGYGQRGSHVQTFPMEVPLAHEAISGKRRPRIIEMELAALCSLVLLRSMFCWTDNADADTVCIVRVFWL